PSWSDWGVEATAANCEVLDDGTVRPWLTRPRHMQILRALWEHRPFEQLPLATPSLFVMARPDEAEEVRGLCPDLQVELLAGDHDLHVQQPEKVAELLLEAYG